MSVTFGLGALSDDAYDMTNGETFSRGYDRAVDLVGPEFTTLWASDHLQFGEEPLLECWTQL
jgi:hypothetical protein